MATTTKRLEIELTETTDPNGIFANGITDGADAQASMERFDALLLAAVSEAFPEATVTIAQKGRIWEINEDGDVNGSDTPLAMRAQHVIQQLADDILNDGAWIVEADAPAGCDRCGDTAFADDQLSEQPNGQRICGACELTQEQAAQ